MKRWLFLLVVSFFSGSVLAQSPVEFKVIAGTSLVEDIVRDLTDGKAKILTLVSGASCPGHGDMKATDAVFAADAQLAILPLFQKNLPPIRNLFATVNNGDMHIEIVDLSGNWMAPPVQRDAVMHISRILMAARPAWAANIEEKTQKRLQRVNEAERMLQRQLRPLHNKPIIAAKMQADFLGWAGFSIVATYGGSEEMTPSAIVEIVDKNRGRPIIAVIDNMQSGAEAGRPLAEELKVPHLVLSNFPGSSSAATDYFSLLDENIKSLLSLSNTHHESVAAGRAH